MRAEHIRTYTKYQKTKKMLTQMAIRGIMLAGIVCRHDKPRKLIVL